MKNKSKDYREGWKDCRNKAIQIVENNQFYLANALRTGYVNDSEKLIKKLKRL